MTSNLKCLIPDYSTTTAWITNPHSGGYWARHQLYAGITNVARQSILLKLQGWRSQWLDGRLFYNRWSNFNWLSLEGNALDVSYPAVYQELQISRNGPLSWRMSNFNPGRILLNGRFFYRRRAYSSSVFRQLLSSSLATWWQTVRPYCMKIEEVTGFCGGSLRWQYPGRILLNGRFLHNCCLYSNSVSWRLLGLSLATPQQKICAYRMKTQEVQVLC